MDRPFLPDEGLMAAVAVRGKLRVPTWESEVTGLLYELPRLAPEVRLAISGVLESLLTERTLSTSETRSTEALLATLRQQRLT